MRPESFPKEERIRKSDEFTRILERGRRVRRGTVTAVWRRDEGSASPNRVGIAAGKRLGNAVLRNRLKRRLREAYRRNKRELPCRGVSIVFLASRGAIGKDAVAIRDDVVTILREIAALTSAASSESSSED